MTDLDLFREFVTYHEASDLFKTWQRKSPGDYSRWVTMRDVLLAGKQPMIPIMVTYHGKSLAIVGRMAAAEGLPQPIPFPSGDYPVPDATYRKVAAGSPINPRSGDKIWLLPGNHGEIYAKDLINVEIIGDPAGGVFTGAVMRNHCSKVHVRNIVVRPGVILPFHTYNHSDSCQATNVTVQLCADSGFMDEDSVNALYDTVVSRDSGHDTGGPGYATHGMYMRCEGVIQNAKIYNAKGGGISMRRQGMMLKNVLCDSKCDIGLSFYSFTTAPGEIVVADSTFGGVTADVWISDEHNGPTPTIDSPVGPHPLFRFQRVNYSGISRDGFNVGRGIAANIVQKDITNLHHAV